MKLAVIDWLIIALYFSVSIGIGIFMLKKSGKGMKNFFLGNRKMPWYIAGTGMVATTFAADTPLAVTELVHQYGIAGNWLWWNMLLGGMLTVFFFARLWRRSGILTDAEFVALRYSGKPARFLRGFRALYIGILMNIIVIAWVNLAMEKILRVMFPDLTIGGIQTFTIGIFNFSSHLLIVGGLMIFTAVYSALSGLWGISLTDSLQFIIAMTGSIILAVFAVNRPEVGGIAGLQEKLPAWSFDFFPDIESNTSGQTGGILRMSTTALIAYLGVQWWASWYPGAEPGGGGYIAQRMMSAKDERHSVLATLWFQIAHYALRPWPWIIAAFAALILYPELSGQGESYVMLIKDLMPSGLLGLLIAAFLAAYMSTLASQTVWGTSYIVNDFYKPFIKPQSTEKQCVKISRLTTFLLMIFSLFVSTLFDKISDAWKFVLIMSSGIGLVLLLRWYWHRINAWSELSAMLAPYLLFPVLKYGFNMDILNEDFEPGLIILTLWSTAVWLAVTFLTKPESDEKLKSFYTQIHPGGIGWRKVERMLPEVNGDSGYASLFFNWIAGCLMVMGMLFGIGKIIFREYLPGTLLCSGALILGLLISRNLSQRKEKQSSQKS